METLQIIKMNNKYNKYLDFQLAQIEAKYIGKITAKTKTLLELGKKFENPDVLLGSHKGYSAFQQQDIITLLANGNNSVPVKLFLLDNERVFVGNTSWAIAYLIRYGEKVKLKEIPFFIVDLRERNPIVIDYNGSAYSQSNIQKAITSAQKLSERLKNGWRPIENKYTLGMLKNQLLKQVNKEFIYE